MCKALVRKILQVSTTPQEDIEHDQTLLTYGLDSLIAVELRNWMASELGSTIPLLELSNSPSIEALAQIVASQSSFVVQASFPMSENDGTQQYLLPINI